MSGIYIPGMEMPTICANCPMLEGDRMDGLCHAASRWLDDDEFWTWYVYPEGDIDVSKPCNCPLVPVPPHGDLIDYDFCTENYELLHDDDGNPVYAVRMRDINNAPTIIPADKEGAPVRHGKWQITDAWPHNVYCSECHTKFAQTHWAVWEDGSLPRNYCPNCGAKMDE